MARRARNDRPDSWHHVMNRGIARRTMFETKADIAVLEEQIGEATDRGELEVHAYSILTTHYHLLVRSPEGTLARAMQRIQTEYSRCFNRGRRRDGPLVRGRYTSREVDTLLYRKTVVRYIDRNPIAAGISPSAADYPYGSARAYAGPELGPPWLVRTWVESAVRSSRSASIYEPHQYAAVFGRLPDDLARVVEARWRDRTPDDPLEDLVGAAPGRVAEWMQRKAMLADGTRAGCPVIHTGSIKTAIHDIVGESRRAIGRIQLASILLAGLSRQLAGASMDEIAKLSGCSPSSAGRLVGLHREQVLSDPEYRNLSGEVAHQALSVWRAGESWWESV